MAGKNVFSPSKCWQISPSLFCFFCSEHFFSVLFQRTVWNSEDFITYRCDTGLPSIMKLENAFSQSKLSFKLTEIPEYLMGATIACTNANTANLDVLVFSYIVSLLFLSPSLSIHFFLFLFKLKFHFFYSLPPSEACSFSFKKSFLSLPSIIPFLVIIIKNLIFLH